MDLVGWSKTLAREVGERNITSNIVVPGTVATGRIVQLSEARAAHEGRPIAEIRAESVASIPLGRYGDPREYADVVTFLASPQRPQRPCCAQAPAWTGISRADVRHRTHGKKEGARDDYHEA